MCREFLKNMNTLSHTRISSQRIIYHHSTGTLNLKHSRNTHKGTEMLTVIVNYLTEKRKREDTKQDDSILELNQEARYLEVILYSRSRDEVSYCDVRTLQARLLSAQTYLDSQINQVEEKLGKLYELTRPSPFTKEEVLGCLLSHRLFASKQVRTKSMKRSSSMMTKRKPKKEKKKKQKRNRWSVKPLRLMVDNATITDMINRNASIVFRQDYRKKGMSKPRYEKYKVAKTCAEALKLGAKKADLKWDLSKGIAKAVEDDIQTLICKNLQAKRDEKVKMGISKFERSAVTSKPWKQNGAVIEKSKVSTVDMLLGSSSNVDVDSSKPHVRKTARKSTVSSSPSLPVSTGVVPMGVVVVSEEKNKESNNCVISSGPPLKKPRIESSLGQQQEGGGAVMGT